MAHITIPAEGLMLHGAPGPHARGDPSKTALLAQQAMRLDLDEGVLQGILRSARSGSKGVHVSFGKSIVIDSLQVSYCSRVTTITVTIDTPLWNSL